MTSLVQYCFYQLLHKFHTANPYSSNASGRILYGTHSLSHSECCDYKFKSYLVKNTYTKILLPSINNSYALKKINIVIIHITSVSVGTRDFIYIFLYINISICLSCTYRVSKCTGIHISPTHSLQLVQGLKVHCKSHCVYKFTAIYTGPASVLQSI